MQAQIAVDADPPTNKYAIQIGITRIDIRIIAWAFTSLVISWHTYLRVQENT
jgi:hypothetical protein